VKAARALVVDDDPGILDVLEIRLRSMGLDLALFDLRMEPALNDLLESCLALAQARVAGREIRVAFELDPALPQAALDPREIRKVFLNVIVNALEAMEAGGTLTLRTRRAEQGLVEAKDSGTGLGMAVARTVVEQHEGRMDIRSQLGRGTQARVLLPLGAP
jgi:signal transduction histidine kinase